VCLPGPQFRFQLIDVQLGTCASKVDVPAFTDRVFAALKDVNEIKVLGFMLLHRLFQLAPTYVAPRLDEMAESLKVIMKDVEVKEDTVKQDLERKGGSRAFLFITTSSWTCADRTQPRCKSRQ
jgi:hypothetical protein